jgi:hypothetical protein
MSSHEHRWGDYDYSNPAHIVFTYSESGTVCGDCLVRRKVEPASLIANLYEEGYRPVLGTFVMTLNGVSVTCENARVRSENVIGGGQAIHLEVDSRDEAGLQEAWLKATRP